MRRRETTWEEEKQPERGRMEACHLETRAQASDLKQPSNPTEHTHKKTLSKLGVSNMMKKEPPKMQAAIKGATRWENKDRKGDETKSANRGVLLELWKRA